MVISSSDAANPSTMESIAQISIGFDNTSTGLLQLGPNSSLTRSSGNAIFLRTGGTFELAAGTASLANSNIDMFEGGTLAFSGGSLTTTHDIRAQEDGANFVFTLNL